MGTRKGGPGVAGAKKCPGDTFLARGRGPGAANASHRDVGAAPACQQVPKKKPARARPSRSAIFAHSRAKMQTSPHSRFDSYTETPSGVSFFACGRGNRGFCDSCQKNNEYLGELTKIQNRRRNRGNSHKNSLCMFRDMLFYTRGETAGACPGGASACAEGDAAIRPAAVSRGQQMGQEPGEIIWKGS